VPCGQTKIDFAAPALELYSGSLFRAYKAYALSLVPKSQVWVLSAKHGIVHSTAVVEPYNLHITDRRAVSREKLAEQITAYGLDQKQVLLLGTEPYAIRMRDLIPNCMYMIDDMKDELPSRDIGYLLQWLWKNHGRYPIKDA
jgi:hypothetical protein